MIRKSAAKWLLHYFLRSQFENNQARWWFFVCLIFTNILAANAQETPPLTNYSSALYKAHNQNWAIDQSSDEIIYAANSDGLMEYDGASWKLYPFPDRQIVRTILCDEAIPNVAIGKVLKQPLKKEQRIYAGGFSEFGYWKKEPDAQLKYYSLSKQSNLASLKTEEIWHITKTPKYIYFQSFSRMYRYDGKSLKELETPGNFMFARFVQNRLLLPTIGKGIYELKGEKFEVLPGTKALSSAIISSILPFSNEHLLITTVKHGLFLWKNGVLTPWNIPLSEALKRNIVNRAIMLKQDSSLVFGTIQSGVYVIEKNGNEKYHFNKETGFQNNTVLALKEDSRKQLWIGLDQGIDMIKMSSPIISYETNDNPLGSTYAAAIWRGKLYVGSNKGVFVKKWLSTEAFRPVPGLEGQTWSLNVFDDQLLCGHNDATYQITENGIVKISDITGGWIMLPIRSENDSLLLQGSYSGLHVYRKNKQNQWAYAYPVKGIPPIPVQQIVQDNKGHFWLGHAYRGLYLTKLTAKLDSALEWKEFKAPKDLPGEFAVEIIRWKNRIYIRSGNVFLEPDNNDRLHKSAEFAAEDDDEAFKVRTGVGNEWFKIFMNRISFYNSDQKVHNLPLSLIRNNETIIPVSTDYYFFCLDNGYALYNRSSGSRTVEPPSAPIIRKVANLRTLSQTFSVLGRPSLPSSVRSLRISFALPVYGQSTQFKYRLRGLSDQWSEWTDQNFVEFTNLESTSYVFEVKSSLNNNVTAYQFSVKPYWRETLLAKLLFAALVALVFVALILYQEKRLRRHRNRLMKEQEEKLHQQRLASERQIMQIQNEKLQSDIQSKSQKLSNIAINVVRKNEILEEIRDELKQVKAEMGQQLPNIHYQKLMNSIERNVAGKEDWELFEQNFDEVHEQFFKRLRSISPSISPSELRLAACLRMNLSTKEMAPALGISVRGVEIKRYRLRKKLGLGADANLVQFMMDI